VSGRLVLVRHGQSYGNVERRLDTRPPGAALTDLGRDQARTFARGLTARPGLIAHSVAVRASQTAREIADEYGLGTHELEGIHEVQVGQLEDRSDDAAIEEFNAIYQRWHQGDVDLPLPDGETARQVLARYLPVVTQLRLRYLDDDAFSGDIVMVSHHLGNTEAVVLAPITDGRWSCVQWGTLLPPFYPEPDVHPVQDALESADPMG
jgi:broad specificity phosphatase PhoE